jgi:hypothetical protein
LLKRPRGGDDRINGILRRFTKLRDGIASAGLCDTVILQPDQDAANPCASIEWSARCANRSRWLRPDLRRKITIAIHQMKRLWRYASDF